MMDYRVVFSFNSPKCCACHTPTMLCNSSRDLFEMLWHCKNCNINYHYSSGNKIVDKTVAVGEVNYYSSLKG